MDTSKMFKKDNGDKYEVKVSLYTDGYQSRFHWSVDVFYCPAGKRKFSPLSCKEDWRYRKLSIKERDDYYSQFLLSNIPIEWITEVQQEILKELSSPIFNNTK